MRWSRQSKISLGAKSRHRDSEATSSVFQQTLNRKNLREIMPVRSLRSNVFIYCQLYTVGVVEQLLTNCQLSKKKNYSAIKRRRRTLSTFWFSFVINYVCTSTCSFTSCPTTASASASSISAGTDETTRHVSPNGCYSGKCCSRIHHWTWSL